MEDIEIKGNEAIAKGKFAPKGMNPEADMACALYEQGILKAVSPGYIQNDDGTRELLELSFCSVPAGRYALSLRQVRALGYSTRDLIAKGFMHETKGAVPYTDHGNADPDTAWDGPAEVKACGDDLDKLKAICAWFDSEDADVKSAYKLPHHRASDLKAVWKGVEAAGSATMGARGGVKIPESDIAAVRAHLAKHYKAFDKEPPWEKKSADPEIGDDCELDDGTPGVLADDPDNSGRLICVPREGGKAKKSHESMNEELTKNLTAEHERHGEAVMKAIDEFEEKAVEKGHDEEGADHSEMDKAIAEFTEKMEEEHEQHHEKCMKAIDDAADKIDPEEKKSIDEFRKAVADENLQHAQEMDKAIDEFKHTADGDPENHEKSIQEFREKAEDELDRHEQAHLKMCKQEFGEGEDDEAGKKMKAARAISAKNKGKLDAIAKALEDHHEACEKAVEEFLSQHRKHTDETIAALKELAPDGDEGEEGDGKKSHRTPHQRPSTSGSMSDLEAYLFGQRIVRQSKTALEEGLRQFKEKIRDSRS